MKPAHKALLLARATAAVSALYHNATVTYPRELYGRTDQQFEDWFADAREFEIDYIGSGGRYGSDYAATLAHPANAGKLKSPAARARYIAHGLREQAEEREDCGALTGWRVLERFVSEYGYVRFGWLPKPRTISKDARRNDSLWERITEWGNLYTFGRGGRTLAPDQLYSDGRQPRLDLDELGAPALVDLIRVVESFNRYVGAWCAGVPEQWREYCAEEDAEAARDKRNRALAKAFETRERHYWEARGVLTVTACGGVLTC